MFDVFISHSSLDKDGFVRDFVAELKAQQITVWFDEDNINYGDSISGSVFCGLQKSICLILIISKNSLNKSNWAWIESGFHIYSKKVLLPILLDINHETLATILPFLADKKYLSVKSKSDNKSLKNIASKVAEFIKQHIDGERRQVDITKIIFTLNNKNLYKNSELVVFIKNYEKSASDYNTAYIWAEKIIQCVCNNISCPDMLTNLPCNNSALIRSNPYMTDMVYEHFRYMLSLQESFLKSGSISAAQFINIENSIFTILDWYSTIQDESIFYSDSNFSVIAGNKFTDADIAEAHAIEKKLLPHNLISEPDEVKRWFIHNGYSSIGIRDNSTKKIIAFCTALPVRDAWYNNFRDGNITDVEISLADIEKYDFPGIYNIYISVLCVHPDYQGPTQIFKLLYDAMVNIFINLTKNEIFIYRLLADASTPDGVRMCRFLGMEKVCDSKHTTSIYESHLIPPKLRLRNARGKSLIDYYAHKYEALKKLL